MSSISFRHNIREVKRTLNRIQRKQVPFAASLALNNTAFEVRKYVVNTVYPNAFPRGKNKRFPNVAFRVQKSTKRRLRAAVFDRLNRYFLDHHIQGRPKRPLQSSALAIPVNARRLASGRIRKADLEGGDTFVKDYGRGPAVWRRKRKGLQLLFALKESTPVRRSFRFYELGRRKAADVWPREWDKAIARALRTAR